MDQTQQSFELLLNETGLVDVMRDLPDVPTANPTRGSENTREMLAMRLSGAVSMPIEHVKIWSGAAQQPQDMDPSALDRELQIFNVSGQRRPVIGRKAQAGVEILTDTYMVEVVRLQNEQQPEAPAKLLIDLQTLDDYGAYRLIARYIETGPAISSYDRGLFYQRAVTAFGSESAAARECAIDKGTISRNLDVVRAVELAGHKIAILREVSQRDAAWLMGVLGRAPDWSEAPDQDAAMCIIAAIGRSDILPAQAFFTALKAMLKTEKPKKGQSDLLHDGHRIGTIRCKNSGDPIRIDLVGAGDVELEVLIKVIRRALATARTARTN